MRALLATLFFSRGTPMLTAGDEFGRSQRGNNNAYAQDNELTWLDQGNADRELIAFTGKLAELRKSFRQLAPDRFLSGSDALWLGASGNAADWQDGSRVLGLVIAGEAGRLAVWINGGDKTAQMKAKPIDGFRWKRILFQDGPDLPGHSVSLYAETGIRKTGIADETLFELAAAAGIDRDWWEVDGTHHEVAPSTLRFFSRAYACPMSPRRGAGHAQPLAKRPANHHRQCR